MDPTYHTPLPLLLSPLSSLSHEAACSGEVAMRRAPVRGNEGRWSVGAGAGNEGGSGELRKRAGVVGRRRHETRRRRHETRRVVRGGWVLTGMRRKQRPLAQLAGMEIGTACSSRRWPQLLTRRP
uniref:Uncharacterized protein n=1 Tax=Oryza barthii TaxID=65489 RepID=A0A0D3G7Z4_9ORYZ